MGVAADPGRTDELYVVLGEFCHGVRDRLNALKISLYVANQGLPPAFQHSWSEIHEQYLGVEHFVDQFQTVFRPMSLSLLNATLGRLIDENREEWDRLIQSRGANLFWSRPKTEPTGAFDPMRLTDALDRFVHWRAEQLQPGTMVYASWTTESDQYRFTWEERHTSASRPPATPSDAARQEHRCANMALPMLTRVMALHGGAVSIRSGDEYLLELRWPVTALDPTEAPRPEPPEAPDRILARKR
jgi:hypothetical protein